MSAALHSAVERARSSSILVALAFSIIHFVLPSSSHALTLNDGMDHVVNDSSLPGDVSVEDSPQGVPTSLTLVSPGVFGSPALPYSLHVRQMNGGHAEFELQGDKVDGSIQLERHACVTINGGVVVKGPGDFHPSIHLDGRVGGGQTLAYLRINGGSLISFIDSPRRGHITITNGTIGQYLNGYSLEANNSFVRASGGLNAGAWWLIGTKTNAVIRGGTYGQESGDSILSESAHVEVHAGTLNGAIMTTLESAITITGGSIGVGVGGASLFLGGGGSGAAAHISGGTLTGSVRVGSIATARIGGGSIGSDTASRSIHTIATDAVVQLFGGTLAGNILADSGTIHVYGQGLLISSGQLIGTLRDGTPINATVATGGGQIVLHNDVQEVPIVPGSATLLRARASLLYLPASVLLTPGCDDPLQNVSKVAMEGDPLGSWQFGSDTFSTGAASMILERQGSAISPPGGEEDQVVPVEMIALQLRSQAPIRLVSGSDAHVYMTLQSDRGRHPLDPPAGPPSSGTMTLHFGTWTFDTELELFYDVREGSGNGPILYSDSDSVQSNGPVPWSPDPPPGAVEIPGHAEGLHVAVGDVGFSFMLEGGKMELTFGTENPAPVPGLSRNAILVLGGMIAVAGVLVGSARRGSHASWQG